MRLQARVTFAMRDLDRLKVIEAVIDGDLKSGRAAERHGLTSRQVQRLANRYRSEGPVGLTSRKFNRPSNNLLDGELKDRVLAILRDQYADFGPTLAAENPRTRHDAILTKETVRQLQIASGMWVPRKLPLLLLRMDGLI